MKKQVYESLRDMKATLDEALPPIERLIELISTLSNGQMLLGDLEVLAHYSKNCDCIVEIGTARGLGSMILAANGAHVDTIDIYAGIDLGDGRYDEVGKSPKVIHSIIRKYLDVFNSKINAIKGTSRNASKYFEDETLDMVYVDGGHDAGSVSWDYNKWLPKVKVGGHILFHDTCPDHVHVHKFVNENVAGDPQVEEVFIDTLGETIIRAFKKVIIEEEEDD